MRSLFKSQTFKLRLVIILGFILLFLLNMSLQSCSMGRYRTTWGKAHHPHLKHTYYNNTDKSW
jgi:hypothetical protein